MSDMAEVRRPLERPEGHHDRPPSGRLTARPIVFRDGTGACVPAHGNDNLTCINAAAGCICEDRH